MAAGGVKVVFHYVPLHSSPMGYGEVHLPVTDNVSERLVRLPLFAGLEDDELAAVLERISSFRS